MNHEQNWNRISDINLEEKKKLIIIQVYQPAQYTATDRVANFTVCNT